MEEVEPKWVTELRETVNDNVLFERIMWEIRYDVLYHDQFNHGTSGHLERTTIALLAKLLSKHVMT